MKYSQKLNRHERKEVNAAKLAYNMGGSGLYVYENNTDADLKLPKPTNTGMRTVGPRKRFEGDSYFMRWVGAPMNLLRLIEEKVPKNTPKTTVNEENKMADKLILDQPDTVTSKGKIEHIVDDTMKPLNDSTQGKKGSDVLLTENPLDGVAIIKG